MADEKKGLTDEELRALVDRKIAASVGSGSTADTITADRLKAMKYYKGEPFGDEKPGSSSVVSRDVAEAVDAMMPSLMKIFSAGDTIATFNPTKPAEEEQARQATDYVNWVWDQQNSGYRVFHSWFKDALLQKLGTIKIFWDDARREDREEYEGLTQGQLMKLLEEEDLELQELSRYPDPNPEPQPAGLPPMPAMPGAAPPGVPSTPDALAAAAAPAMLYDAVFRRVHDESRVRVMPVAPDETLIDRQAGEDELPWGNRRRLTVSELIKEFPDKEEAIKALPFDDGQDFDRERQERFSDEGMQTRDQDGTIDPLSRMVWVVDGYFHVDFDGDGYAELRKVTVAGATAGTMSATLENVEYDENPFACLTPKPMPHKLIGTSVADDTMDIQLVKSTLVRQGLNNLYLQNSSEVFVTGEWDIDALINRRPGNVIRGKAGATVTPATVPNAIGEVLTAVQYFDQVRDQRTGAARFTAGPGADALNSAYTQTATGANMVDTASQERIAYYARNFAETGVKRAFRRIFELLCKHQQKSKLLKLRGKWIEFNPAEWNARMDMAVSVGLGTNNKAVQVQQILMLLTQVYAPIVQLQGGLNGPLVFAENVHHALTKLVEAMGFKSAEQFFPDPSQVPTGPGQKPPDPKLIEIQAMLQKSQLELQSKERLAIADIQSKQAIAQLQAAVERELGWAKVAVDNKAIDVDAALQDRTHATDALFRANDSARADKAQETETAFRKRDADRADQNDARSADASDRDFAAKYPGVQLPPRPQPPAPRRLKGVTLVHDAAGKVAAAKRHFDDDSSEEIPIARESAAPPQPAY